jgi:hypothetical protein
MSAPPATEVRLLFNLRDAVSTAHVLAAAAELGLIDQVTSSGPKDANELAHACATHPSMTALLLDALAALGVVRRDGAGRYGLAIDWLPVMKAAIRGWSQLSVVVRSGEPLMRADSAQGASDLYPSLLPVLSAMFTPAARRAAQLLDGHGADVLDVGAARRPGASHWPRPRPHSTSLRSTCRGSSPPHSALSAPPTWGAASTTCRETCSHVSCARRATTSCCSQMFATSSTRRTTVHCYGGCALHCAPADWSRSSTCCRHAIRPSNARSACMRSTSAFAHLAVRSIR